MRSLSRSPLPAAAGTKGHARVHACDSACGGDARSLPGVRSEFSDLRHTLPALTRSCPGPSLVFGCARAPPVQTQPSCAVRIISAGCSVRPQQSTWSRAVFAASARASLPSLDRARFFSSAAPGKRGPHGGTLVNQMVTDTAKQQALLGKCDVPALELSERQACDVELLGSGAFSPLAGFMTEDVWKGVLDNMRLPGSNLLFGLPVVLDTDRPDLTVGKTVALNFQGQPLAVMTIESAWKPDKAYECLKSYGHTTLEHPGCRMIAMERKHIYIGGTISVVATPKRVYPVETPAELFARLPADKDVVAFQCRNPIHRAHYELFIRSLDAPNVGEGAVVLVHPTCGPTQEDDIDGVVRYKTYEVLKAELNNPRVFWAYLPYSMHMAGPREAIQHMILRKNHACTHFIVGRDMAGCKSSLTGEDFYGAYDAQDMAKSHAVELGMQAVPSLNILYTEEKGYVTADEAKKENLKEMKLSGTKFRKMLRAGEEIPEWFAFKSVVKVLREA